MMFDLLQYKLHYDWEYNTNNYSPNQLYKIIFGKGKYGFGYYAGTEMHKLSENSYLNLTDYVYLGKESICKNRHRIIIGINLKLVPVTFNDINNLKEAVHYIEECVANKGYSDYYHKMIIKYLKVITELTLKQIMNNG